MSGRTPQTKETFCKFVDAELASRLKDTRTTFDASKLPDNLHARIIILTAYANFEGFLERTVSAFLAYVAHQRHSNAALRSEVLALMLWGHRAQTNQLPSDAAIQHLREKYDPGHRIRAPTSIDLENNVSSTVLRRLVTCLCFQSPESYAVHDTFIDEHILKTRNAAAHGAEFMIGAIIARERASKLLDVMRSFSTDIQNVVTLSGYVRQ